MDISKLQNDFDFVNPKMSQFLHISNEGMDYSSSNIVRPFVGPEISINIKKKDNSFNDYYDSQHTKIETLGSINRSNEKLNSKIHMSSDNLRESKKKYLRNIASIQSNEEIKNYKARMKVKMNEKLATLRSHKVRGSQSSLYHSKNPVKIFKTELSNKGRRYIAVIPDGSSTEDPSKFIKIEITQFLQKYSINSK